MSGSVSGLLTPLPPSPLRSYGPGLQESVHHYALRIAAQCCFSIRKLEEFLLRDDPSAPKAGNAVFPSSWIGPRSNFRSLLAALKRDTGVRNLHTGTFYAVADVMGRGGTRRRQIRGEGRVWCPACYLQWDDRSSSEPLIWAFDMLSACSIHGVQLEARCYSCGASQGFSVGFRERRTCQECLAPLGHGKGIQETDKQAVWVNATLLEFTLWLEEVDKPISSEKYLEFLTAMRSRRSDEEKLPPVIRAYVGSQYDTKNRRRSLPTVSTLLNLAAFQGVAIQDILCEPTFAASPHLAQGATRFEGVLFRRRDLQLPHRRVVYVIARLAGNEMPIPPPSVVWGELGLWCDGVRDYCPLEHQAFKAKFQTQSRLTSLERFKRGATSCMRLLQRIEGSADRNQLLRQHLETYHDFNEAGAEQCVRASLNLREALDQSSNEAELVAFENRRAREVARWAAGDLAHTLNSDSRQGDEA